MNFLITGGAGFIGSNLATFLLKEGHEVMVVDDFSSGKKERLPRGVRVEEVDVCDSVLLGDVARGADVIVHLAAIPQVQLSIDSPAPTGRVNVEGTLSVLEVARNAGVPKVIFASSSAVYGDQDQLPINEEAQLQPKSPYALHKLYGEQMLRLWSELYGLKTVSLRFFNVYGPNMDPKGAYASVVSKFLSLKKQNLPLTITGDGKQTRDFVHVDDVSRAMLMLANKVDVGKGEVFNVGSGSSVSVNDIADVIGGEKQYVAPRVEPKHSLADVAYVEEMIGWKPEIVFENGLKELRDQQ